MSFLALTAFFLFIETLEGIVGPCKPQVQLGSCLSSQTVGAQCGGQLGYGCQYVDSYLVCCPLVDYENGHNVIGPALGGSCPGGYTPVFVDGLQQCVSLASGLCTPEVALGTCSGNEQLGTCGGQLGYGCSYLGSTLTCCPLVDWRNDSPLGPAIGGSCPDGYTPVYLDGYQQCFSLDSQIGYCPPLPSNIDQYENIGYPIGRSCPQGSTCYSYKGDHCFKALNPNCKDTDANCAIYVENGFCQSDIYTTEQKKNSCEKSCDLCD